MQFSYKFLALILVLLSLWGCASTPPPPPEPKGELVPINHYNPVTGEDINNGNG